MIHRAPSQITTSTLELTAAGLAKEPSRQGAIETFYRGAGVEEDVIELFRSRIGHPIEFYSCFISYSHADKSFAQRIYADLQARGIRCWLDADMQIGDKILAEILDAIRVQDKVLLCCSEDSLASKWVGKEIETALQREMREDRLMLVPLNLDGYLFDGYTGTFVDELQGRLAADFTGWEHDNATFEKQFERVVRALRTDDGVRERLP